MHLIIALFYLWMLIHGDFITVFQKKILPANITYILILPYLLGVLTAIYTIFKYYTLLN